MIRSYREAARLLGSSASRIEGLVRRGRLPPPPWREVDLRKAGEVGRVRSEHGTVSRWRAGCDCDQCSDAHNTEIREMRRDRREEMLAEVWPGFLADLRSGVLYREACEDFGLPPTGLRRMIRHSPELVSQLDDALMEGRDPDLRHGAATAYRRGCRCPECAEYRKTHA